MTHDSTRILSTLRLEAFDPARHAAEQRSTRWPELAIVPHVLPDGSANPDWNKATHCVMGPGEPFRAVLISSL